MAFLKDYGRWGHVCATGASPRSRTKKVAVTIFHYCPWRSGWYQICNIRVAIACGIRGWHTLGRLLVRSLNQRVRITGYLVPGIWYMARKNESTDLREPSPAKPSLWIMVCELWKMLWWIARCSHQADNWQVYLQIPCNIGPLVRNPKWSNC